MAEFAISQRGVKHLVYRGFRYRPYGKGNAVNQNWRCVVPRCKGKASTGNPYPEGCDVEVGKDHCHPPDSCGQELAVAVSKAKEAATTSNEAPRRITSDVVIGMTQEAKGRLVTANLKRKIQRVRQREGGFPRVPHLARDLVLPDEYKKTSEGEPFLLFDNIQHADFDEDEDIDEQELPPRILIFSSTAQLDNLQASSHTFFDGTFKLSPALFFQVFVVHAFVEGTCVPCAFAFLQNKESATYETVFQVLRQRAPRWMPQTAMCDLELGLVQAFQVVFPNAQVTHCFFHLSQAVFRQACQRGLRVPYEQDERIMRHVKFLAALAFVPEADVLQAFQSIEGSPDYPDDNDDLHDLYRYFEATYLGRPLRDGRRRRPRFPITSRNQTERMRRDLPSTNNLIEGWHRGLQASLDGDHPSIWRCIRVLQKEEVLANTIVEQIRGGQEGRKEKVEQKTKSRRLKLLMEKFQNLPVLDYLRGVSYNLELNL